MSVVASTVKAASPLQSPSVHAPFGTVMKPFCIFIGAVRIPAVAGSSLLTKLVSTPSVLAGVLASVGIAATLVDARRVMARVAAARLGANC